MAELTDEPARQLGIRIISIDRPGVSGSTFVANRALQDWPPLIEELTSYLQIVGFRMLAISGGAPYAYVTAHAFPKRVLAVAIASGAPPIAELQDHSGLLPLYRTGMKLFDRSPRLIRALFHLARPVAARKIPLRIRPLLLRLLQPCDADVLRDSRAFEACFESSRRAWRTSAAGVLAEAEIYIRPWEFRLEDVTVPVRIWHGTADRAFSYVLAQQIAKRLPNSGLRLIDGAGHYSLPIRHMAEILDDVRKIGAI